MSSNKPRTPRPSKTKAPAKSKSLEANVPSKQESSPTTAEEKQGGIAFRNATRASAETPHQPNVGAISKRPPMFISDLPSLPETESKTKQQRIA
jgi:hypothetical protein